MNSSLQIIYDFFAKLQEYPVIGTIIILLVFAVMAAVAGGKVFTTTVVLVEFEHPFPSTTVRVYTPAIARVAAGETFGDC